MNRVGKRLVDGELGVLVVVDVRREGGVLEHESSSVLDDVEKAGKQLRPLEAFGCVVADEHFPACVLGRLAELEKLEENNKLEVEDFLDGTRAELILRVGGEPHV